MKRPHRLPLFQSPFFQHAPLALSGAAIVALLAGGCAVDQKKEVQAYRQVLDSPKPPAFAYHPGEPLTLEGAMLLANYHDEALAQSGEDYLQALIDRERQFAAFLPQISLQPSYNWIDKRSSGGGAGAGMTNLAGSHQGQFSNPVVASYNVFNGFQDLSNVRRAGYTSQQREMLLLDLQQTTMLNLAQAYYAVITNERSVQVLLNSVSVQNAAVADMQGRERAGVARPLDVAQTEATASAARVQLIQAQNNVRTGRLLLAFLTAAPVQDAPLVDRLPVPSELPPVDQAVDLALRDRQDVRAGEAAIEAARQSLQAAIGQYYPSLSINLDYFLHRDAFPTLSVWEGALNLNVPIFTAGLIHANVRTAWSVLRQAWLTDQHNRRQVAEQVRAAYENVAGSRLRINELRIEVKASREALEESQFSYNAGLATNLDVLTATNTLLSSQLSLVTERLNFKLFYLQLLRAEGLLNRPDSVPPLSAKPVSQPDEEELTTPDVTNKNPGVGNRRMPQPRGGMTPSNGAVMPPASAPVFPEPDSQPSTAPAASQPAPAQPAAAAPAPAQPAAAATEPLPATLPIATEPSPQSQPAPAGSAPLNK